MKKTLLTYGLAIPGVVVILDQLSKLWATNLFDVPISYCQTAAGATLEKEISPIVDLALLCNEGISWGLLQGDSSLKRWALTIFAFAMCAVLIYSLTKVSDRLNRLSIALIIGGAIGNGIDRALFGAVTDFINFGDIGFKWVFNIADSAITCGVIGLLLAGYFTKSDDKPTNDAEKTAQN